MSITHVCCPRGDPFVTGNGTVTPHWPLVTPPSRAATALSLSSTHLPFLSSSSSSFYHHPISPSLVRLPFRTFLSSSLFLSPLPTSHLDVTPPFLPLRSSHLLSCTAYLLFGTIVLSPLQSICSRYSLLLSDYECFSHLLDFSSVAPSRYLLPRRTPSPA